MKKFAFNLEKVLELRAFREQEAKIALGRATGILAELERRLDALARERARIAASRFDRMLNTDAILRYDFYIQRLDATRDALLKEAVIAAQRVEEARQAWLIASQEKKVLDKLKDKRAASWRKDTLAAEAAALDEIKNRNVLLAP